MASHDIEIKTLSDLVKAFAGSRESKRWFFRGQGDASWPLMPKAGRDEFSHVSDKTLFETWMKQAIAHVQSNPKGVWDWLAIAQHHGLATRLLDWSMNPLIAAYFAVSDRYGKDGVIFAIRAALIGNLDKQTPWTISDTLVIKPRAVVPRIIRQGGVFTCHPEPTRELTTSKTIDRLVQFTIKKEFKPQLMAELSYFGFNAYSVYPDLDGLSSHVNWTATSKEYYGT